MSEAIDNTSEVATKCCSKCGQVKPVTEFYARYGQCKACTLERQKQYQANNREKIAERKKQYRAENHETIAECNKQYRAKNRDRMVEYFKQHYLENREKIRERHKQYYAKNREKQAEYSKRYYIENREKVAEYNKRWHLLDKYALTPERYDELYAKTRGKCCICNRKFSKECKPDIDHCHNTSVVRGIICGHCNRAIGLIRDNPAAAMRMAQYLDGVELFSFGVN